MANLTTPPLASVHPDSLLFFPVQTAPDSAMSAVSGAGERQPLLPASSDTPRKKPFYRPRPLWLVPFAITAAIVRGMTLAPRVEVFTQLSCHAAQHQHYNHTAKLIPHHNPYTSLYFSLDPLGPSLHPLSHNSSITFPDRNNHTQSQNDDEDEEEDPRTLPSNRCLSNPVVQAGAARLQTIMTITMGGLSALTTGWWGQFGERYGRTRVLAIATFGLFLTDLLFILVSTPHSPFSTHGHKLLILAPLFEGLLGGWSTLQCATTAYLSDCTSPGSRANIFSRFTGVFSIGAALGPSFGAFLIRHPVLGVAPQSVTEVFWVAIACSFVNLVLVLFVFPESLSEEKQHNARGGICGKGKARASGAELENTGAIDDATDAPVNGGIIEGFFSPLAVFLPVVVHAPGGNRRRDWSLTFLACALFGYMLSTGVVQIKYLYAGHVYAWGAEQLSYYISFLNGARALNLLLILPFIIATFKPVLKPTQLKPKTKTTKPLTKAQLAREMDFDIRLASFSLLIDLASHGLVAISPLPTATHNPTQPTYSPAPSDSGSQAIFVASSALSSFGSGTIPAIQSLALCIAQARALDTVGNEGAGAAGKRPIDVGRLFGALAVLQAVGQTILGPVLFGLVYSETVATYPKAIFATAAGIMVGALALMTLARPVEVSVKGKRRMKRWEREEAERGRSRVSKDLRGGSASFLNRPTKENTVLVGPSRF